MRVMYFTTEDGEILCPECQVPDPRESDSPVFSTGDWSFGETCGNCGYCLAPDDFGTADWYTSADVTNRTFFRWSRCEECGHQRPWNKKSRHYHYARRESLSGGFGCESCHEKKARF